jgi:DNA-3-methyladenine glycosylase
MRILSRAFFQRPPQVVAPDLLGKVLVRRIEGETISGVIVETEAYLAENDAAAHAARGKTLATQSLYLDGGHAYIHRIHMQYCVDAVCQTGGVAGSVLIRALQPLIGIESMQRARGKQALTDLTSGPGKLCQALQIDKQLDGVDLTDPESSISIWEFMPDEFKDSISEVAVSGRVGITKDTHHQLRFYIRGSKYLSR